VSSDLLRVRAMHLLFELADLEHDDGAIDVTQVAECIPSGRGDGQSIKEQTAYALMSNLSCAGAIERVPPLPGRYKWRVRIPADAPSRVDSWPYGVLDVPRPAWSVTL
jgi:hypothetical protein